MPMNAMYRYILYSAVMHGFLVLLFGNLKSRPSPIANQVLSLELIEPKIEPQEKLPINKKLKLIVDQDKVNTEEDLNAKYLSSHNQKILKETVTKNHGAFQNKKMLFQPNASKELQRKAQGDAQTEIQRIPREESPTAAVSKEDFRRQNLAKDLFGSYKYALEKALEKTIQKAKGMNGAGADVSRSRDYVPGTEEGLETLLSTREFVYYTYYNRIRNQLSQYWEPKIKDKVLALFKKGRRIASTEDRITKVQIVLDARGVLKKVQVLGPSGIQDLDEVAVEAFRAAAPFPNPPKGIIESDGTIKIQWDFVVES